MLQNQKPTMKLTPYTNKQSAKDWTILYMHGINERHLQAAWENNDLDLMVFNEVKDDGSQDTFIWIQVPEELTRAEIQRMFIGAEWVGSTSGLEEFKAWFGDDNDKAVIETHTHIGCWQKREPTGMIPGRKYADDVASTIRACDDINWDDSQGGD